MATGFPSSVSKEPGGMEETAREASRSKDAVATGTTAGAIDVTTAAAASLEGWEEASTSDNVAEIPTPEAEAIDESALSGLS